MLSTSLFSVVTPDRGLIQAQQYCAILLTTLKNAGSKTLFSLVFINPEQVVHFWLCGLCLQFSSRGFGGWSTSDEILHSMTKLSDCILPLLNKEK